MRRLPTSTYVPALRAGLLALAFGGMLCLPSAVQARAGGGCFPPGTPIATPDGAVAIEQLERGAEVLAVDEDGRLRSVEVRGTTVRRAPLYEITTSVGTLTTTGEHPIRLENGGFLRADRLRLGQRISTLDTTACRGGALAVECARQTTGWVLWAGPVDWRGGRTPVTVHNLHVEAPHTYVANGIVVHNKGGGGGGGYSGGGYSSSSSSSSYSSSSGSGGGSLSQFVIIGLIVLGWWIFKFIAQSAKGRSTFSGGGSSIPVDTSFARSRIERRARRGREMAERVAAHDPDFDPDALEEHARHTFIDVQEAWGNADYGPIRDRITSDLYALHDAQLAGMRASGERNQMRDLEVEHVDLIHFRYTEAPDEREVSMLITAKARDVWINAHTGARIRGDVTASRFQEVWVFQHLGGRWKLREIEQIAGTTRMTRKVYIELDDAELQAAADDTPMVESAESELEHELREKAVDDPLWVPEHMEDTARTTYGLVVMARDLGDTERIPRDRVTDALLEQLRDEIAEARAAGHRVEHRNFCVRNVDIVVADTRGDRDDHRFIARITSHAAMARYQGARTLSIDDDLSVFRRFAVFVRDGDTWRLDELLRPEQGSARVDAIATEHDAGPIFAPPVSGIPEFLPEPEVGTTFDAESEDGAIDIESDGGRLVIGTATIALRRDFRALLSHHQEDGTTILNVEVRQQDGDGRWTLTGVSSTTWSFPGAAQQTARLAENFPRVDEAVMRDVLATLRGAMQVNTGSESWGLGHG